MKRRDFLKTSAGFAAIAVMPGIWNIKISEPQEKRFSFKPYKVKNALAPILQVTPEDGFYLHTYYDVCPWSPSQKFMVVTKIPFQDRLPVFGDLCEICVIDLEKESIRTVYKTKSWGFQTASNVNWGATDQHLFCNDFIGGETVAVRIDLETNEVKAFAGPMYHVAPDESCVVSFPQELWSATQLGLGTPPEDYSKVKKLPPGAAKDEGIWRTDLKTNTKKLIVTLADAAAVVPEMPPRPDYTYYFWHTKFNKQGTRLCQVLRCIFTDFSGEANDRNPLTLTFNPDGSNIKFCLPDFRPVWGNGGGHPNFLPNGDYLVRVLKFEDGKNYFATFRYDGADFKKLCKKVKGGGHPSIEEKEKYLVTDSNTNSENSKIVNLHLVDINADEEQIVCSLPTIRWEDKHTDNVYRVDGHPTWSRDYKKVCLQAAPRGARQLFVIDLSGLV
ncbi:MAG: twin-arginine translocation signal domain-containing protein [Melioribacteraceae bacterium]